MLKSLELENFKAFGERVRIKFAPITLIFGKNSAGKSSILHALSLLKQSREENDGAIVLLPRSDRGYVDLGTFQDMIFAHDLERTLQVRIGVEADEEGLRASELPSYKEVGLEWAIRRRSQKEAVHLERLQLFVDDIPDVGTFVVHPAPTGVQTGVSATKMANCVQVTQSPFFWKSAGEKFRSKTHLRTDINRMLEEYLYEVTPEHDLLADEDKLLSRYHPAAVYLARMLRSSIKESCTAKKRREIELNHLRRLSDLFENSPWEEMFCRISSYLNVGQQVQVSGLAPRRVIGSSRDRATSSYTDLGAADLLSARDLLRGEDGDGESLSLDVAELCVVAGKAVDRCLRKLVPLGPFRRPPQRWYVFSGSDPINVGYQGQLMADLLFRDSALKELTNDWLERLDAGYVIDVKSVSADSGDLFTVQLIDTKRLGRVSAAMTDVGFGVSQLLPFIVQSLMGREAIVTIEQPEVHLHPRLQADIGDLLITAIAEPRRNQFVVETHSEHLILRIMRRIRETAKGCAPEGLAVSPDDVAVYYVSAEDGQTTVRKIDIDTRGEFVQPWPDDFFEIDFYERFG